MDAGHWVAGVRAARARGLRAPGKPGLGSGCCEQVTGRRMRPQGDISGFREARGTSGPAECGWRARARGQSGSLNLSSARGSRGGGGAADEPPRGGGPWTPRASGGRSGPVAGPAGAGAREKSGRGADLLPAAARPDQGRPEARGAPRARVHRGRAPYSLPHACCWGPPACRHPCFLIVPELSSCVGSSMCPERH